MAKSMFRNISFFGLKNKRVFTAELYPLPRRTHRKRVRWGIEVTDTVCVFPTVLFKPTAIQRKALVLLKSGAKHILLFGGSRSGKT
jgi:hypothetical protein